MNTTHLLTDVNVLSQKRCPTPIAGKLAYATNDNFTGRVVDGYSADAADVFLLETSAAIALCDVQTELNQQELGLYFFDGYRPQRAVVDFKKWCDSEVAGEHEIICKQKYFPNINKSELIAKEYLGYPESRHNFAFSADVSLIDLNSKELLDMGACFDCFDDISHLTATANDIGEDAYRNRQLLVDVMKKHNFIPYVYEYWHFDFANQVIKQPIDISITNELRGCGVN